MVGTKYNSSEGRINCGPYYTAALVHRPNVLDFKVWQISCRPTAFDFQTLADIVNNVKGTKIQISLKLLSKSSFSTSADDVRNFQFSQPHFENHEHYLVGRLCIVCCFFHLKIIN